MRDKRESRVRKTNVRGVRAREREGQMRAGEERARTFREDCMSTPKPWIAGGYVPARGRDLQGARDEDSEDQGRGLEGQGTCQWT